MALAATPQQQQFLTTYQPYAQDAGKQLGVDPNVILGQWAHETQFGSSLGAHNNNLGGITAPTGQYYSYSDPGQFTDHYVQLLQSKYPQVLGTGSNANKFVTGLYQGHYFTGNPGEYVADVNNAASLAQQVLNKAPPQGQQQTQSTTPKFDALLGPQAQAPPAPSQAPAKGTATATPKFDALMGEQPSTPALPAELPNVSEFGDVGPGAWFNKPGGAPAPADNAITRIGQAAGQAFQATPSIQTPMIRNALNNWAPLGVPVGKYVVNPLLDVAGAGVGALAGAGAAAQQGTLEASKAITGGEALGRDLNIAQQVAPMAGLEIPQVNPLRVYGAPDVPPTPPAPPRFAGEYFGEPRPGESLPAIISAITKADETPAGTVPTLAERETAREAAAAEPPPGSVGAMVTPGAGTLFTPAEEAMYRRTAEGQRLLEPQIRGEPDTRILVPGSDPNLAEQEQTVTRSRELKALGISLPEASQEIQLAAQKQNVARTSYLDTAIGSEADEFHENAAKQQDIATDKAKVFAPTNVKGNVDMTPAVQQIDTVLSEPFNIENPAMQTELGQLRNRLVDANGDPRAIPPEQAWGLRYSLDQMTDKAMKANNPNLHYLGSNIDDVAGIIDQGIEAQAPGYSDMLATYKAHMDRIREMQVLQAAKPSLFQGTGQTLTYGNFQRFMKNVVKARMTPDFDLNPYKAISDDTMNTLWNIRDDLRRSASAQELAKAAGSDSIPNMVDQMLQYAKLGGSAAADAMAEHIAPFAGPLFLRGAKAVLQPIRQASAARKTMAATRNILYPGAQNPLVQQQPGFFGGPTPPPANPLTQPP